MKKNKGKEIFQNATVQCQHCGRYFIRRLSHQCNTGYRKHHHKWLDISHKTTKEMKDEGLILKAVEYCNDIPARVKDFLREEKPPKEEPKPEFKVGDWVNWYYVGSTMILRIARIKDDFLWYKSDASCGERNVMAENCRLATPAEIESHLRKIAEGKGFVDGVKIRGLRFGWEGIMKYQTESYHGSRFFDRYVMDNDCFNVSDDTNAVWESIYEKGKWAEIIPNKKKLPKTKEELFTLMLHFHPALGEASKIKELLKDYED